MAPNQYAIGVAKNKFALCDSEEEIDPHEILKRQEKEKEERKKSKVVEKSSVVKSSRKLNTKVGKVMNKQSEDAVKSRQSYPPVVRKPANSNDNAQQFQKHSFEEPPNHVYAGRRGERVERMDYRPDGNSGSESGAAERGRGGSRGFSRVFVRGGGGRGRGSGYDGRLKREYDRQSGSERTGGKPVEKRKTGGSHNCESQQDDFYNEEVPQEETKGQEEPPAESAIKAEPDDPPKEESASPPEEGEKPALTLDEWKARKTSKPRPSYNIRQPGEGEDQSRWKTMYALSKKTEEEEDEEDYDYGEFPQRVGRQRRLEIDVRFYDRRGRGRGRGSLPGPAGRSQDSPPRVDDEADFPSLVRGAN